MSFCKRIISASMAVVITFMLFAVPKAEASLIGDAAYAYTQSSYAQWIVTGGLNAAGYYLGGTLGTIALPGIGTIEGTTLGTFLANGANLLFDDLMEYLAEYPVDDAYADAERGFVDGLDYTTVNSDGGFIIYPSGFAFDSNGVNYLNNSDLSPLPGGFSLSGYMLNYCSSSLQVYSAPFILPDGVFKFVYDACSGDSTKASMLFYGVREGSSGLSNFNSLTPLKSTSVSTLTYDYDYYVVSFMLKSENRSAGSFIAGIRQCHIESLSLQDPISSDSTSRPTSVMDAINKWNNDNPIITNSPTINYYIMPSGGDDFYSPALYDEEELVYTDPVTGTQYLTSGWTYDYLTRCYTLDMADGFTIGDAAIDTIKLIYGDELLTVDHYSGGSLIQTDEYNYVMASGSECGLNGHSYTYETVKEPTCIAAGERKYTCSICGDEYAEEIPMGSHAYEYSVIKEASCISGGTTANTCRICGDQTVEHLSELGHDWQETGSTTTTYALPEGTSCPVCARADFAAALDEAAGTYSCTCNGCGTVWTVSAVITYGITTYTCTRCGTTKTETDDPESGLFDSIGNLIADGITWATDKLKQLVENLSGINDIFNDYADSVRENTGQYPALLGEIIALMPEDFMIVVWFGIVALVVLAVWKKWFS